MFERMGILPYPNPSTGVVNFASKINIKVYDSVGKLILESNNVFSIKLKQGFYLIEINKEDLNLTTKIIIQ